MTNEFSSPLLDADGETRVRRFAVATLASAFVIAAFVSVAMYAASPEGGWGVAIGVGAMTGFWMCPLGGAVFGNGMHEIAKERAERRETAAPSSAIDTATVTVTA